MRGRKCVLNSVEEKTLVSKGYMSNIFSSRVAGTPLHTSQTCEVKMNSSTNNQNEAKCDICRKDWITHLKNHLKNIKYPKYQHQYNMGHDFTTKEPNKAMDFFLKSEFNDIVNRKANPHDVIFSPDSYLYGGHTEKALTKKTTGIKNVDSGLLGLVNEETLFYHLKKLLKELGEKNTVVIHSWSVHNSKNVKGFELDFIIISEPMRAVVHVEVKTSLGDRQVESATKQLNNGLEALANIPFPEKENWHHCKIIFYVNKPETFGICSSCQDHVINTECDLKTWWKQLKAKLPKIEPFVVSFTYIRILKYFFHQTYIQNGVITKKDLIKYTERKIEESQIFFWRKNQFTLFHQKKATQVALISLYGTGKTFLLREKAKQLIENKEQVVVIVFVDDATAKSVLMLEYKKIFETSSAKLFQFTREDLTGDKLTKTANQFRGAHFFMDEVPVHDDAVTNLNYIANQLKKNNKFLWMACQCHISVEKTSLNAFQIFEMTTPLRYSATNLQICASIKKHGGLADTNFPSQKSDEIPDYLNIGVEADFLPMTEDTPLLNVIEELLVILSKNKCQTIIKVELYTDKIKDIFKHIKENFKDSDFRERIIFDDVATEEDFESFINPENEKILVVTTSREDFLRGFEVTCLVLISSNLQSNHNKTTFSRCKSKLIIVTDEEALTKLNLNHGDQSNRIVAQAKPILVLMPVIFDHAIQTDDKSFVRSQLNDGPNNISVDIRCENNKTGLMIACEHNAISTAKMLIEKGADKDAKDDEGWSPVHFAAKYGSMDCFKFLHTIKADFEAVTNAKQTVFNLASENYHTDIVDFILQNIVKNLDEKDKALLRPVATASNRQPPTKYEEPKDILENQTEKEERNSVVNLATSILFYLFRFVIFQALINLLGSGLTLGLGLPLLAFNTLALIGNLTLNFYIEKSRRRFSLANSLMLDFILFLTYSVFVLAFKQNIPKSNGTTSLWRIVILPDEWEASISIGFLAKWMVLITCIRVFITIFWRRDNQ